MKNPLSSYIQTKSKKKALIDDYFRNPIVKKSFKAILEVHNDSEENKKGNQNLEADKFNNKSCDFNVFEFLQNNIKKTSNHEDVVLENLNQDNYISLQHMVQNNHNLFIFSKHNYEWYFNGIRNQNSELKKIMSFFYTNQHLITQQEKQKSRKSQSFQNSNTYSNMFKNQDQNYTQKYYETLQSLFKCFIENENHEFFFETIFFTIFGFHQRQFLDSFQVDAKKNCFIIISMKKIHQSNLEKTFKNYKHWKVFKEEESVIKYLIQGKFINKLFQDMLNCLQKKNQYFEIFSNFLFLNSLAKQMKTSSNFTQQTIFSQSNYYQLNQELSIDHDKFNLQNLPNIHPLKKDHLYYIELMGSLFGSNVQTFFQMLQIQNPDAKIIIKIQQQ